MTGAPAVPSRLRTAAFKLAFFTWTAILVLAVLPVAWAIGPGAFRRYAAFWQRGVQRLLAGIVGVRHVVTGLDHLPPGPVVFASKHQSAWETVTFHTVCPDVVIPLKQELGKIPLFGWYLRRGGNIFVDRAGGGRALKAVVRASTAAVARGWSILIFPEGTRTAPGAPPDYKAGVAALYAALNVPVVPVALDSGRFWPTGGRPMQPGTVTLALLEPIQPGLERRAFMALLEARIEAACRALAAPPPPAL